MSRIGGDARPSTSPSIERNPPAVAVEAEAVEREAVEREAVEREAVEREAAEVVDAGLPQLLAARVRLFPAWTSSTRCWPRMST